MEAIRSFSRKVDFFFHKKKVLNSLLLIFFPHKSEWYGYSISKSILYLIWCYFICTIIRLFTTAYPQNKTIKTETNEWLKITKMVYQITRQ